MANKKTKKVNPKEIAKKEIMEVISKALQSAGYDVADGENYAMTKGTIVATMRPAMCRLSLSRPRRESTAMKS